MFCNVCSNSAEIVKCLLGSINHVSDFGKYGRKPDPRKKHGNPLYFLDIQSRTSPTGRSDLSCKKTTLYMHPIYMDILAFSSSRRKCFPLFIVKKRGEKSCKTLKNQGFIDIRTVMIIKYQQHVKRSHKRRI